MSGVLSSRTRWLEQHLDEWVDAGIVDGAQRDAIVAFESDHAAVDAATAPRLTIGAEVAAYLGGVLAITGGVVAVSDSWEGLSFPARLGLAVAIMVIGIGIGHWLFRFDERGTDRLGGFVTTVGVGGLALTTGLVADEFDPREGAWIAVAVGVVVLTASLALWRNLDRPLQLATVVVGFGVTGSALTELTGRHWWVCGLVFVIAGGLLSLLGHLQRANPPLVALAAGGVGAYLGAYMLGDLNRHLGPAAALAIALLYVLSTLRSDQTLLLVVAILGATIACGALLETTFRSALAALGIAVIGLALVAVVVSRSVRRAPS